MGINLGTCVTTAMVCSIGSTKDAKRTGIVHIAFNTIGTIIFMIAMTIMERAAVFGKAFWVSTVDSGGIANFQTIFNLLTAVVLLPFTNQLVKLSKAIVKEEPEKVARHSELLILDEKLFISPAVALSEATKAVGSMGHIAMTNFARGCQMLVGFDEAVNGEILKDEDCLDQFADTSDNFLINLSKVIETESEDRQVNMLLQAVPDFERIGDYATNLAELGESLSKEGATFSESARQELDLMFDAVNKIIRITVDAFITDDNRKAKDIEPLEEVIDDMVTILRDRHTKRLKNGSCSVSTGLVFMEALTYLERASDQCSSIAVLMLARQNESILKNHYDYLREVHAGNDEQYIAELKRRREQYMTKLESIKF